MSGIRISTKMYQMLKKKHDEMFFEYDIDNDIMNIYRDYFQCDEEGIIVPISGYSKLIFDGDKIHKDSKKKYLDFLKSHSDGKIEILRGNSGDQRYEDEYLWFEITGYYSFEDGVHKKTGTISCIHDKKSDKYNSTKNRFTDVDTGLYTRAYTDEKMDDYIILNKDTKRSWLIIIDIDRFSDINDAYGIKFADALLAEFADLLRIIFEKKYIIGRYDGDVFGVLAKDADEAEVKARANQVLECLNELYCGENLSIQPTASIAIVGSDDAAGYFEMYDLGEKVISYIKSLGGGKVKTYQEANKELEAPVEFMYQKRYIRERGVDKHSVSHDNMVAYAMSLMEDTHDIKSSLNMLIRRIGRKYSADRVSVIAISWETLDYRYEYQWTSDMGHDMTGYYSKISIRDYYKISNSYDGYGIRIIDTDAAGMLRSGIEAAIYNKGRYAGALRIEIDRDDVSWSDELKDDLPLLANLIGTYLSREAGEKRVQLQQFEMEVMSTAIKGGMKIVLDDRDRTILTVSDSLCELFGYTIEEFLGITDGVETNMIYHEDIKDVLEQTGTQQLHDADSYTLKYRVKCKDGTLKWVLDYGRRVKDQEGRSVFYTTCTDVTEIEESAAQIRDLYNQSKAAEECTRIALQNTKTAEFYYYPEERKMIVPSRSCELIGCRKEYSDMPYDFATEMVSSETQKQFIRAFNSVSEGGAMAKCEFRVRDKENWIRITLSAMEMENRADRIVVGIAEDISDETSIAQERMRIISSISDSYFGMYHMKPNEGSYATFSQSERFKKLLGERGSIQDFIRVFEENALTEESKEIFETIIENGINESVINEEHRVRSYDYIHDYGDHKGWVRVSFILVAMKGGKVDSYMITFMDIDEERREELETRKALKDAFDMANNANNAKSDFLSKMSHDIRTPMNAIIGMTSIAQTNIDDTSRVKDCLKKIDISSKHLLGLINDVLDMSKIESGKMDLTQEEVDVAELVDTISTMLRSSVEERRHSFKVSLNNIVHRKIIGDGLRIRQVLVNLLSNAIKYTPDGGNISLTVTEKDSEYSDMAHYEFRVKDNGMGMSKEYMEKLFDPFTRAEDSRTSKIQGTGLGMTITKQIVNMMDGNITVKSEVDKGSEFIVTMFFKIPEDACDENSKEESVIENTDFSGKRILLAEDNEINMEIALEILSFTGAEVETASNGQEAFEKVRDTEENYFDMALMDVQMPIMNGYEATQAIRGLGRADTEVLPILACTANAFAEDIRDAEKAGMNGHITKPIDFEQLLRVMNRWLS